MISGSKSNRSKSPSTGSFDRNPLLKLWPDSGVNIGGDHCKSKQREKSGAGTAVSYTVELRFGLEALTMFEISVRTLYDPELMHGVQQAVDREYLVVDAVLSMHQPPVAWKEV